MFELSYQALLGDWSNSYELQRIRKGYCLVLIEVFRRLWFEGDGECYYHTVEQMIYVEYESDDTLILRIDDFLIMLALYQSAFVLKNNGLLANEQIPQQLYHMLIDKRNWFISRNYKLLGIEFLV